MEPEQPRWLPRYNKNKHELDLCNYSFNIGSMNLTVDDI